MVGGADGSRVVGSGLILARFWFLLPVLVAGLQVWWAGVWLVVGNVRQMAKTNASPQNMLLIITEFIR